MKEMILKRLESLSGKLGFYYKNLITQETITWNEEEPFLAASVIKMYIMAKAFEQCEKGMLSKDTLVEIKKEDCVPSCGALTYMHDGLKVTIEDLYTLMIILSDNSATNILIDLLGMEEINDWIETQGFLKTKLNRKMFDKERANKGIQNYISPKEVGDFLKQLYDGTMISQEASKKMIEILSNQRLNGKIPFYIHNIEGHGRIAHKTGEDSGITHDVGIIYGKEPFILVFLGNETDVAIYEREMAEIALLLYEYNNQ